MIDIAKTNTLDDLLTARQVQDILKVDRITIYRMLQDGRLKGVKIGQQWRFTRREVERLLGNSTPVEPVLVTADSPFPVHCVQTIQDLFSAVGQISSLVVDKNGEQLTQVSSPCAFCTKVMSTPAGLDACRASWRRFAEHTAQGSKYFTCHAGLQYIAAPIYDKDEQAGAFLAGQFYWQPAEPREEAERLRRLAESTGQPLEAYQQAAPKIPVIAPELHSRVEEWPFAAARAIQSILHERLGFMERLHQIASLTQIL